MVHKEQERNSELNDRITADLRRKAQESSQEAPDLSKDIEYVKDLKKTGNFGWIWAVLVVLALLSLVLIIVV